MTEQAKGKLTWRLLGRILYQSGKAFFIDSGPQWAAAVAYYGLLSIFPLLLGAASIAAFFVDPNWAVDRASMVLEELLPGSAAVQVEEVVKSAIDARGSVSIFSILTLLWSGSRVFGTMTKALNIAYNVDEHYSFIKRTAVEIGLMLTVGVLFLLAVTSRLILSWLWGAVSFLPERSAFLGMLLQRAIPAVLLLVTFFLIYRFVPRRKVNGSAALAGAVLATAAFLLAQPLFVGYVQRVSNLSLVYGPIVAVIVLVFWAWLVALILIFGGELVSHIQDMLIEGRTPQEVEAGHQRRSPFGKGRSAVQAKSPDEV